MAVLEVFIRIIDFEDLEWISNAVISIYCITACKYAVIKQIWKNKQELKLMQWCVWSSTDSHFNINTIHFAERIRRDCNNYHTAFRKYSIYSTFELEWLLLRKSVSSWIKLDEITREFKSNTKALRFQKKKNRLGT